MALIECPGCKKMVSDRALACPKCGNPISDGIIDISPEITASHIEPGKGKSTWKGVIIATVCMIGLIIFLVYLSGSKNYEWADQFNQWAEQLSKRPPTSSVALKS
jgi:uncharacterized membrane protein YvbJ